MAYPSISAPYGLKPINLLGGQVFAGATRQLPIQFAYASNIGYGDIVQLSRGFVTKFTGTTDGTGVGMIGVFLGCEYTSPTITTLKQVSC